ncbi:hypothetical protein CCMA1212_001114 [Trichoderma ghanense]|uniref:Uncharacterized protein n=1 Tax=Trichoderma ghanense TaxID=65468 RepID=A0ABY2HK74_9HYPO
MEKRRPIAEPVRFPTPASRRRAGGWSERLALDSLSVQDFATLLHGGGDALPPTDWAFCLGLEWHQGMRWQSR